jgi:hypothetical protein
VANVLSKERLPAEGLGRGRLRMRMGGKGMRGVILTMILTMINLPRAFSHVIYMY